ncbi:hypothetical protein EON81_19935 [bacterium]|nr:MAG: hypothetical protein EON81_19935 [bacterium]
MPSAYESVRSWTLRALQERGENLADDYFDPTIRSVLREILTPHSLTYAGLSAEDKEAVDEAAGYRTAVREHGPLVTGGVSTGLSAEKTDDVSRNFVPPQDLYDSWESLATLALSFTSFGRPLGGGPRTAVNGPTRARCGCREYDPHDRRRY